MDATPAAPPLADLLRWLGEMPPGFSTEPEGFPGGRTRVRAVVADVFETWTGQAAPEPLLRACDPADAGLAERNRLRWVLAACHLLWHAGLRPAPGPGPAPAPAAADRLRRLFVQDLPPLAAIVPAERVLLDEERREELVRLACRALARPIPGEGARESEDRLAQVDSVERQRILAAAADKERRARAAREAELRRRAEEEAASKAFRE